MGFSSRHARRVRSAGAVQGWAMWRGVRGLCARHRGLEVRRRSTRPSSPSIAKSGTGVRGRHRHHRKRAVPECAAVAGVGSPRRQQGIATKSPGPLAAHSCCPGGVDAIKATSARYSLNLNTAPAAPTRALPYPAARKRARGFAGEGARVGTFRAWGGQPGARVRARMLQAPAGAVLASGGSRGDALCAALMVTWSARQNRDRWGDGKQER